MDCAVHLFVQPVPDTQMTRYADNSPNIGVVGLLGYPVENGIVWYVLGYVVALPRVGFFVGNGTGVGRGTVFGIGQP